MQLHEYLSNNGISQAEFARLIGESPQNVQRYVSGKRRPSDDETYQNIAHVTSGQVTANDFYGLENNGHSVPKIKPKKHRTN